MNQAFLLLVLLVAFAVWLVLAQRRLVGAQNRLHDTWGVLEDILERRHHPAVAAARHAQGRLGVAENAADRVERLAARSREAHGPEDTARAEDALNLEIAGLLHAAALGHGGGDGDDEAADVVRRLAKLHSRAREAAEAYNKAARDMNVLVEAFPSSTAAALFGYRRVDYYEPEQTAGER